MILIIYLLGFVIIANAGVAILWSVGGGIELLKKSYAQHTPNRHARRMLAWNLIEPGLTVATIALILFFADELSAYAASNLGLPSTSIMLPILATIIATGPMVVLYILIPLVAMRSANPTKRWAARKTATLGIIKLILIIITLWTLGKGIIIAMPYLFWSIKKIRAWDEWLEDQPDYHTLAIAGSHQGMQIVPSDQPTAPDTFNVL